MKTAMVLLGCVLCASACSGELDGAIADSAPGSADVFIDSGLAADHAGGEAASADGASSSADGARSSADASAPSDTAPVDTANADGATRDGATSDQGGLRCVSGSSSVTFTTSKAKPLQLVQLSKLVNGRAYRRIEITLEYKPAAGWGGQCYNPYYKPPRLVPVFQHFAGLRRGGKWCNALIDADVRNPSNNQLRAATYYGNQIGRCSGLKGHELLQSAKHGLSAGQWGAVRMVYDLDAARVSFEVGGRNASGAAHAGTQLMPTAGAPLNIALGFEVFLECFDAQGNKSSSAACCHVPPLGASYRNVSYTACY